MTGDATFEDGADRPLNLGAMDLDDLSVVSSLVQDAVLPQVEIRWDRPARRVALLINRFRWEDRAAAERMGRPVERVQSVLSIDNVLAVSSQGLDRSNPDTVLSVLSIGFDALDEVAGHVVLTFAGDGALRARIEALEVRLKDVTRPYVAPSRKVPDHPE